VKNSKIKEMERQHAPAYARIPSEAAEFEEWESEQVWSEPEKKEPGGPIQPTATTGERTKVMEDALEKAAEIRHQLEGRHHSESTQDIREDRER
jgi:hypothetical protein